MVQKMSEDVNRNRLITDDVCEALKEGQTPIVLTGLTAHVETLTKALAPHCKHVVTLVGSEPAKEKHRRMEYLQNVQPSEPLVIVATGKYVGEGFDYPRLDTLFLALPVSWKGIVAQYAGRLHREYTGKKEVRIYDYIDIRMPMCDVMYRRRLKGYASEVIGSSRRNRCMYLLKAYKALFLTDTPIKSCFSMICPKPNIRSSFLQRGYG